MDRDDGSNASHGLFERFFDSDAQRRQLGRAVCASTLHGDSDGAVVIDCDEFDISAIGDQRGADPVEPGLDDFMSRRRIIPCLRHLRLIGPTSGQVESGGL
jgi:hypothetical protein